MNWINSGGGPLICIGRSVIRSWRGVDGLGEPKYRELGFRNDYERACATRDYLGVIPVFESTGIVLGDMPLDTTVLSIDGLPLIVRVFYSDQCADVSSMLSDGFSLEGANEVERTAISIQEESWHVFDSAYPGSEGLELCLSVFLPLGEFWIKTYEYMPDQSTSLLLHKFSYSED